MAFARVLTRERQISPIILVVFGDAEIAHTYGTGDLTKLGLTVSELFLDLERRGYTLKTSCAYAGIGGYLEKEYWLSREWREGDPPVQLFQRPGVAPWVRPTRETSYERPEGMAHAQAAAAQPASAQPASAQAAASQPASALYSQAEGAGWGAGAGAGAQPPGGKKT